MNICGIVSEYNPFHSGHAYQIAAVRAALGEDTAVVCAMSGSFVQRGEAAVFGKSARAEAAVCGGADLVLELPLPWALSSAEHFARGAVGLLAATGAVTHLSFGSECGDHTALQRAAEVLLRDEMDALIRDELQKGVSYAAARQTAAERLTGEKLPVLSAPNDILAVEYLKAIRTLGAAMEPLVIRRAGAAHDSAAEDPLPSASLLRRRLADGERVDAYMPEGAAAVLRRETEQGRGPVLPAALETAVLSRLRMLPVSAYDGLPDASEGLSRRLYRAAQTAPTLEALYAEAAAKRYALSRLRRMTLCAALGLRAGDNAGMPPYLRVLAANERGLQVLHLMRDTARCPVISKPAAVHELGARAQHVFSLEAAAADLYALGFPDARARAGGRDWQTGPVIVR